MDYIIYRRIRNCKLDEKTEKKILILIFFIFFFFLLGINLNCVAASAHKKVHFIKVDGEVDKGLERFISRGLEDAVSANSDVVILEIDTFGGYVDSAVKIRDEILSTNIRTIGYVNSRAWSAGALIAIACDEIAMNIGSSIGAAETRPNEEKYISAFRSEFQSTAESNGKDSKVAAAMVDSKVVIEGLSSEDKILTLTDKEAFEIGFADYHVANRKDLLEDIGLSGAFEIELSKRPVEKFISLLNNQIVSIVLLVLGFVGLIVEVVTPGFGMPGIIGLSSLTLFFGSSIISQNVGSEIVILFLLGLIMMIAEIFLIPGFGIIGILGLISVSSGIVFSFPTVSLGIRALLISIIITIIFVYIILKFLFSKGYKLQNNNWNKLILCLEETPEKGYISFENRKDLIGKEGHVITPLRPIGTAMIDNEKIEVFSEGGFIDNGAKVKVIKVDGMTVVVRILYEN